MTSMKITAIAPWFGAKRIMAPRIVEQLGPHRAYWEPFCGAMAVLMAKPTCSQETVNDLHGDLINMARVIQHERWGLWLYRRLRRSLVSEDLFWEAAERMSSPEKFSSCDAGELRHEEAALRAADFFLCSWLGRNGVIGTKQSNNNFCVRYTGNGGIHGTRFASAVDSIPAWRRRLRKVTILRRDAFDLLEKIDDDHGTVIYVDPPYLRKGASYIHDFEVGDHARLAQALARFTRVRIVVSYYADPRLAELYPQERWTSINCDVSKSLVQQGKRGRKGQGQTIAPEVLLVNGKAMGEANLFGAFSGG